MLQRLRWSMRRRARRAGYALEDMAYSARRAGRQGRWSVSRWWSALSSDTRALLVGAGVAILGLLVIVLVVIPNLPCAAPLGDECPPSDDAIELVPADATAYAHLDTDRDSEQYEEAEVLADRLPSVTEQIVRELPGPDGARVRYARDVGPWLGDEAALALLPAGGGKPRATALLEVADEGKAESFAKEVDGDGARAEMVGDFLVVGKSPQVRAVVDTEAGGDSLLDSDQASDAIDGLPDHRVAYAFVSEEGADELLAPGEPLGTFEVFVNAAATQGAAAALVTGPDAVEVAIHSVIDSDRATQTPGFFAALPTFEPDLAGEVTEDALAYLALGDPAESLESLLSQARAGAPGIASAFEEFDRQLKGGGGISLEDDLLSLLSNQAAVAIEPGKGGPGDLVGTPHVTLISGDVDADEATKALDNLQQPLAEALTGGAEAFKESDVDGVAVRSLDVSQAVTLSYAVVDDKLVISTSPRGIARVAGDTGGVAESDRYQAATAGFPDEVAGLLYLDVSGLLQLAEQAGLQEDPSYALFRGELRRLQGLGLAVDRGDTELDTRMRLALRE